MNAAGKEPAARRTPAKVRWADVRWTSDYLKPGLWPTWLGLGLLYLFGLLPQRLSWALSAPAGWLAHRFGGRRRHFARVNLDLCYPALPPQRRSALLRGYFRYYLGILSNLPLAWWGEDRRLSRRLEIYGREHLDQARAAGRNVILMTGHVIGLDFGVLALSREYPMVSVYKPFRNPVADWLMFRARTRFGLRLLAREDGLRPVVKAVRAGDVLYYIPDEDLGREHSVFAPFFGIPKATLPTLGRLARLCDAEVIPCTTCYDSERAVYRVILMPPMRGLCGEDETADAGRMNAELERLLEHCPAQYMWGLRPFRTRPDGGPSPYALDRQDG